MRLRIHLRRSALRAHIGICLWAWWRGLTAGAECESNQKKETKALHRNQPIVPHCYRIRKQIGYLPVGLRVVGVWVMPRTGIAELGLEEVRGFSRGFAAGG